MQPLIAVSLILLSSIAQVDALSTEIIGSDGKEQYASYWRHRGLRRKVYDPVLHKERVLHSHEKDKAQKGLDEFSAHVVKQLNKAKVDEDAKPKKAKEAKAEKAKVEEDAKPKKAKEAKTEEAKVEKAEKPEAEEAEETKAEADEPKVKKLSKAEKAKKKMKKKAEKIEKTWAKKMDEDLGQQVDDSGDSIVEHDDMKTATSDWRREFGPAAKHQSHEEACKEYPDNTWCKNYLRYIHSGASKPTHTLALLVALALARLLAQ